MADSGGRPRIVLSPSAQSDIREALLWSRERFGENAAERYRDLIKQALRDIAADPERPGAANRPDLANGIRTYHLFFSRDRARGPAGTVNKPRHFVIFRRRGNRIDILRILHDARDLERHLPEE
ncbi:MAG: type II toxin-antitoxin system RelE/ParE family toxin [Bryobacter sp.]|nr:type II toxin-antitoxin system RelE/ParE family toxin [Bryobacter sp.]